ncbi:hypothetical protein BGX21_007818 [Mortierella sp. AD011]|nr:hypothetical protein BGX21_007818 [Mortierella sp. AD011]
MGRCQYDQETNRLFYIDTATGKRQWEHPNGTEAGISDSSRFREQMDIYEESVARYNRAHGIGADTGSPRMSEQSSRGQNSLEGELGKDEQSRMVEPIRSNNNKGGTSRRDHERGNTANEGVTRLSASDFLLGDDDDGFGGNRVPREYRRKYMATDVSNDDDNEASYFGGNEGFGGGAVYNYIDHNNTGGSEGRFVGSSRNNRSYSLDLSDSRVGHGNFFNRGSTDDDFFDQINSGWAVR